MCRGVMWCTSYTRASANSLEIGIKNFAIGINNKGYLLRRWKRFVNLEQAAYIYKEHLQEFFYPLACIFSSSPDRFYILVNYWRWLVPYSVTGNNFNMDFKLGTQEKEEIPYFLVTTPSNPHPVIPDARNVEAAGYFGSMHFYEIDCPGFSIWYSNYHITRRTCLYGWMDAPMLELHFTVNNTVHYKLEGLGETTLLQGQFNLSYAPFINNVAWFQKDEVYTTFDVHFSPGYLAALAPYFPLLGRFLEETEHGIARMLNRYHGVMTPDMGIIIRHILRCQYQGDLKKIYMQAKVMELLLLSLDQLGAGKSVAPGTSLRPYDIEKIREAGDYLLKNMDNPCTLIELSHKVGINDFKLKKGFKQVYGTTVYEFLLQARMEKAKLLLLETDTPIHEIAFVTGYKNLSSFITAFKKKMGYSPGSFKRMKRS
jgi:AraC family transcriptional regulator, transcriptional activator of the genes for pyochelin and ferripyochelin receptors